MVRPPDEFLVVARNYVPVRVTNMLNVDLNRYRFDFDLTFAVLLMHPDGTVYHRFGGRDHRSAMSWMSMPALLRALKETLPEHESYSQNPNPPPVLPKKTIMDIDPYVETLENKRVECAHCHMVTTAEHLEAKAKGRWKREDLWVWPSPARVGITLERDNQARVRRVEPESAASLAGLRPGDELLRVAGQRVLTIADFQTVLERTSAQGRKLSLTFRREGETKTTELSLEPGWREGDALSYSWRAHKWDLYPGPGFGGKPLTSAELAEIGLGPQAFAFRVTYLVTWGRNAHVGENARRAGIRKGDIVVAAGGKTDFQSVDHFHAWFRIHRDVGDSVEIRLFRASQRGEQQRYRERVVNLVLVSGTRP